MVRIETKLSYRVFTKGASEIVLNLCDRIVNADGSVVDITEELRCIVLTFYR